MSTMQVKNQSMASSDVVLYDGDCRFCTASIETLRSLDGKGRLQFLSLHDPSVPVNYPELTHDMLMAEIWVVTPDGRRYPGADAMKYLSRRLPILFPLAPLLHLPCSMPIWRWLYRTVARNRYRIAGKKCADGTCSIHGR